MTEVEIVEIPDESWADVYAQDYRLPAEDYERRVVEAAAPHISRAAQMAILWEMADVMDDWINYGHAADRLRAEADRLAREHKEREQ